MKKILWALYQPYKWIVYIPWLIVSTLFFGSSAVILSIILNPKIASFLGGVGWAKANAYLTPMFVKVVGRENVEKTQSYVIVANHQSQFDIFVLYGWLGIDFKWVMKQELRKTPALGVACEKVGHIFIDRSNHKAALASINEAKKRIVNGTSVLFFPEGTRSRDGKLLRFKKGAFKMAIDLELPILPVSVVGTNKILPSNTANLIPGKARLVFHEPITPDEYTNEKIPELIEKSRKAIESALE